MRGRTIRQLGIALLVASVSMLLLAGCGGEKKPPKPWLQDTDTAGTEGTEAAKKPAVASAEAGATAVVMLEDGHIAAPDTPVPPGPVAITVTNGGSEVHNLFIAGGNVEKAAGDPLEPGKSSTFTVDLAAGTYEFYCPILDHRQKGETAMVTVSR